MSFLVEMTITSNQRPNEQRHYYLELLVGSETARNIQIEKKTKTCIIFKRYKYIFMMFTL